MASSSIYFLHIPKTAGSSVHAMLLQHFGPGVYPGRTCDHVASSNEAYGIDRHSGSSTCVRISSSPLHRHAHCLFFVLPVYSENLRDILLVRQPDIDVLPSASADSMRPASHGVVGEDANNDVPRANGLPAPQCFALPQYGFLWRARSRRSPWQYLRQLVVPQAKTVIGYIIEYHSGVTATGLPEPNRNEPRRSRICPVL